MASASADSSFLHSATWLELNNGTTELAKPETEVEGEEMMLNQGGNLVAIVLTSIILGLMTLVTIIGKENC